MASKIVAHFKDGKILKGTVADIYTNKDTFYLIDNKTGSGQVVEIDKLKAVFFVKTFDGDRSRRRLKGFISPQEHGTRTVVKFQDGEILYGHSQDYSPNSKGFFIFPADPGSNNTKVFVPNSSVFDLKFDKEIDDSEYAKILPKFVKKIVPKYVNVSIKVTVGSFNLKGAKVKIMPGGETFIVADSKDGLNLPLKPGKYTVEITYDNYRVVKEIEVDRENSSFTVDMQLETHG